MNKVNSTKPASAVLRKGAKAPQAYRPQTTPKCLQLKASRGPAANPAQAKKQRPGAPPAYRPQPVPKVLQRKTAPVQPSVQSSLGHSVAPARASRVVQRMEVSRKDKQAANMTWNEFITVQMPSPKHILESMKLNDANGSKKVSVVRRADAEAAVKAIGDHVKANGWVSSDIIQIVWLDQDKCYQITYAGNVWMTHTSSGQLWPLEGEGIFSPPNGEDVRNYIKKWRGGTKPDKYMK